MADPDNQADPDDQAPDDQDDERTVELERIWRTWRIDDGPKSVTAQRHIERKPEDKRRDAVVGPPPEEDLRQEVEAQQLAAEIERARGEECLLSELRGRRDMDATARFTEARQLADADAEAARERRDAAADRLRALGDAAHANHLLDEAATQPDEPGTAAAAADGHNADAAQQADQPPASEAVRNPPEEPPRARKFLRRRKRNKKRERERDPAPLRDDSLGD